MLLERPPAQTVRELGELRLLCLVRAGDGYVIRAVGSLPRRGAGRGSVDIAFGGAVTPGSPGLAGRVRRIQQWCDDGTPVALVETGCALSLRASDGTEVVLPQPA